MFISCKSFAPRNERWLNRRQKSLFGRQSSISITIMYNLTDWTAGMTHFIKGCTLFVNPWHEITLDPDDSVTLTPGALTPFFCKEEPSGLK